jgi:hypothetical protein
LLDLRPFLVEVSEMLRTKLLVYIEFGLRTLFLADMNKILTEPVMGVGKIRVKLERTLILWNRLIVLMPVSV